MKHLIMFLLGFAVASAAADDFTSCFIPGERAEYKVSWAGIPLAWSQVSTDTIAENGRELIRIRMTAQSYKAYSYIYKVDNVTEVIIDPETALPVRLDLTTNEGSRHISHLTTFYHDQQVAIFQNRITKDIREVPIKNDTQEIYSFLYSVRNNDYETLTRKKHVLFVDSKLYDLSIILHEEELIELPNHGNVPSVKIEPLAEFDGLFLRQGKIMFWVSKEKPRMVTCIRAKVPVGKINIKLTTVSGSGNNFWNHTK